MALLTYATVTVITLAPQTEDGKSLVFFWALTAAICAICVIPILVESSTDRFELITTRNIFLLYALLQFVVSPVLVCLGGYTLIGDLPITFLSSRFEAAVAGQIYVAIGLLAFQLTYSAFVRHRAVRDADVRCTEVRTHPQRRRATIAVLTCIALASFIYLTSSEGGISNFVVGMEDFRDDRLAGTGPIFIGMNLVYFAFVIAYASYLKDGGQRTLSLVLFTLAILIGFLGSYRHLAVETVITGVVMRHYGKKRISFSVWTIALVSLFVLVNLGYVFFRETRGDLKGIQARFQDFSLLDSLYYGLFARFNGPEAMARIIETTYSIGYTGAPFLFLTLATFWVPRVFWADKPPAMLLHSNVLFFPESFQYLDQGGAAAPTFAGTLYWIAGPLGILIGMSLMAALLAYGDCYIRKRKHLFGFALYTNLFLFAAFVSEMVDLHLERFIVRGVIWFLLLFIVGQRPAPSRRPA